MTDQRVDFTVPVRGLEMRCSSVGAGPTVVLLHAGGEHRQVWRPVADRLAARGVRAVSVDQRGHGETAGPVGTGLDVYADDVVALVHWLGGPVVLAGCSLGGLAALMAMAHPKIRRRVEGLVLIDVVPDPDPFRSRQHLGEIEPGPTIGGAATWSLIEDILHRTDELREAAAALLGPVTLIRGTSSWAIDADDQQRFSTLVPHAALVTIEGAGHLVAQDRPRELADAVVDHLQPLPALRRFRPGQRDGNATKSGAGASRATCGIHDPRWQGPSGDAPDGETITRPDLRRGPS